MGIRHSPRYTIASPVAGSSRPPRQCKVAARVTWRSSTRSSHSRRKYAFVIYHSPIFQNLLGSDSLAQTVNQSHALNSFLCLAVAPPIPESGKGVEKIAHVAHATPPVFGYVFDSFCECRGWLGLGSTVPDKPPLGCLSLPSEGNSI